MTAFLTDRLPNPRMGPPTPARVSPAPRERRLSIDLSSSVNVIWRVTSEWLMLLWMIAAVAFLLLLAAGAAGVLSR